MTWSAGAPPAPRPGSGAPPSGRAYGPRPDRAGAAPAPGRGPQARAAAAATIQFRNSTAQCRRWWSRSLDRSARTITELHRLLLEAAHPYTGQIRRSEPQQALDTAARALLGACFHNSVRPDAATGEAARRRYADELADMAIAYLLTPDRRRSAET
ncbi:hypothetical protein [Streptomyces sp. NPDC051561]|uniref:hypothetical protein n=1 Tax=Streptomyces sp. NPDC051561 TaxID=3365658 RepID=UPI0037968011